MRVNERPGVFSQKEARTAEKCVPRREGTLRQRRRQQCTTTTVDASLGGKDLTLTLRTDNGAPLSKGSEVTRERERKITQAKPAAAGENDHQNTNAEAGHTTRTNTKKDCRSKTSQEASHSHEPKSNTEDSCQQI